jgi:hypothetical protein
MQKLRIVIAILLVVLAPQVLAQQIGQPPGSSSSGGSGTVTAVSVTTSNGVSGTVANATTTPAITLNLTAINPASIGATTSGTALFSTATLGSVYLGSGSLLDFSANYSGQVTNITNGTSGSPITSAGSTFKISRYDDEAVANCVNKDDAECNATIEGVTQQSASATVSPTGGYFASTTSATATGIDAVGVIGLGNITGSGDGKGTGAYLNGQRSATTGTMVGAEIRASNFTTTSSGCTYSVSGNDACDGMYVDALGISTTAPTVLDAAIQVSSVDGLAQWHSGLTINTTAVDSTGFGIDEESAAATGLKIGGVHSSYALNSTSTAPVSFSGNVAIGAGFTSYNLQVIGATGEYFASSGTNNEIFTMDNEAGGQQVAFSFADAGAQKFLFGKQTNNSFFIYDDANNANPLIITTGGNIQLGEAGSTTVTIEGSAVIAAGSINGTSIGQTTSANAIFSTTTEGTANILGGVIASGVTATTQAASDSSTKIATTAFANPLNSTVTNGYTELPGGTLIEWGQTTTTGSSPTNIVTFPHAFTVAPYSMTCNSTYNEDGGHCNATITASTTTGNIADDASGTFENTTLYWMVIGK